MNKVKIHFFLHHQTFNQKGCHVYSYGEQLNQEELIGLEFIRANGTLKRIDYENKFGFDKKKAERQLNNLVQLGFIKRKGSGPGTFYEIIAT